MKKFQIILILLFVSSLFSLNYKKSWESVEKLYKQNLPKSALKEVNNIYDTAFKEKNEAQKTKALIYQLTYLQNVEENSIKKMITKLEKQIANETKISKYILHSVTASLYWNFYTQNRYKFLNRHATDTPNKDIDKMSLKELTNQVIYHYKESLNMPKKLKRISVKKFETLLHLEKKSINLRPYIYDILCHRAIDFFKNGEADLTKANDEFHIANPQYFEDYKKFANLKIKTTDKNSFKYLTLKIYQDLIKFHLKDKDALYDVNLSRLKYIHTKSIMDNKDKLFIKSLSKFIKMSNNKKALFALAMFYKNLGDNFKSPNLLKADFPSSKTPLDVKKNSYYIKAYNLCKKGQNKFKNYSNFENLKQIILTKNISIYAENTANANKPFLVLAKYKNIKNLYVKIIKTDIKKYINFSSIPQKEKISFFKSSKAERRLQLKLPKTKDYASHSIEFKSPALSSGKYFIVVSNDRNFDKNTKISYTMVDISNISYTYKTKENAIYLNVFNRETGNFLKNIKAEILIRNYNRSKYEIKNYKASFVSNNNGEIVINDKNLKSKSFFIKLSDKNDFIISNNFYMPYYRNAKDYVKKKTFIFTDRSIYKPGQIVYFKGLVTQNFKNNNEVIPNENIKLTCTDVNHKIIMTKNYTSDDFGSFCGSFKIPNKILSGYINITTRNSSSKILVQEYKRPNFKASLTPQKNLKLNDIIHIKGLAEGYGGYKIGNAKVKYTITRRVKSFFFIPFPQNKTIISSGETKTDKKGNFEIKFTAKPDISVAKDRNPVFIFEINAEIYDTNNEPAIANTSVNIGYKPIYLDLDIAKFQNIQKKLKVKLNARNSMNKPIQLSGELIVYKIRYKPEIKIKRLWDMPDLTFLSTNEFKKYFPYFKYNSNPYSRAKRVYSQKFNFKDKTINLKNLPKAGIYEIEVKGLDKYKNTVIAKKYISVYSKKNFPYDKPFYSFCDKDSIKNGENTFITLVAKENNLQVLLETYKDDTYKKEIITMKTGSKKIKISSSAKNKLIEIRATVIRHGRMFEFNHKITVYNEKPISINLKSKKEIFQCGENGEFNISFKNLNGKTADFGCVMYDASLDAIEPHLWKLYLNKNISSKFKRVKNIFSTSYPKRIFYNKNYPITYAKYSKLNLFHLNIRNFYGYRGGLLGGRFLAKNSSDGMVEQKAEVVNFAMPTPQKSNKNEIKIRKDFAETAFFYPSLKSDKNGNIKVKFTLPQSVTEWKFMGIAHTKNLRTAFIEKRIKTIKNLIITPNLPRFVREKDKVALYSKITNVTDKNVSVNVKYEIFNAVTDKKLFASNSKTQVNKKDSKTIPYTFKVPQNLKLLKIVITAKSQKFNDKILKFLPVQSLEREVFETTPFFVNPKNEKTIKFDFKKKTKNITLEYVANPIWHVLTALPHISSENDESSISVFRKFYANSISSYIFYKAKNLDELFKIHAQDNNENIFSSNLNRNTELKRTDLEMTPWVGNADNETMQKANSANFLNKNQNNYEMETALVKLQNLQKSSGLWGWFSQMSGSRYITMEILEGLGRVYHLNYKKNKIRYIAYKALKQIENEIKNDYLKLEKRQVLKRVNLNSFYINYLYVKSFFDMYKTQNPKILKYFKNQAKKYWQNFDKLSQGKIALALYRFGDKKTAKEILESIKEHFIYSKEFGIYFKKIGSLDKELQTQTILIEAFAEIGIHKSDIFNMKLWLLKQKQTTKWNSSKTTVDACYALLFKNSNWNLKSKAPQIYLDNKKINLDNFSGYLKMKIGKFKTLKIKNNSSSPSWGGLYVKSMADEDKIKAHSGKIKVKKQVFLRKMTKSGIKLKTVKNLKVGDKIYIKLEITTDRNLDFVHIRDSRSACFEAGNIKPMYKYQDGTYFYFVTNNNATNMFFEHLGKGYHTFEYTAIVERTGDYSTGVTDVECLYSPEFSGHSEGGRVKIKK